VGGSVRTGIMGKVRRRKSKRDGRVFFSEGKRTNRLAAKIGRGLGKEKAIELNENATRADRDRGRSDLHD